MNLTRYLKNENEYVPWRSALSSINFIDNMMSSGPDYDLFKVYSSQIDIHFNWFKFQSIRFIFFLF